MFLGEACKGIIQACKLPVPAGIRVSDMFHSVVDDGMLVGFLGAPACLPQDACYSRRQTSSWNEP